MVSGNIAGRCQLWNEILGGNALEMKPLVVREVVKKTVEHGHELGWYDIEREHIQGVIFFHHYEEWILTWNMSRSGLLGRYHHVVERATRTFFDPREAIAPRSLLSRISDFVNSEPVEVSGEFGEDQINIHCPWRRSDVAAACDAVNLLARHADELEACDDMGVWPNKDFTKWVNFANKSADVLGTTPLHPDPTDNL
jgi:hypothetical protein